MKTLFTTAVLAVLIATATTVKAQGWPEEHLGLPGDNLNLFAVMDLFQQSETLEGFERALNSEESGINNLDLNRDNLIDYIMVTDYVDGNVHNIVLSVALNKKKRQDVAVFTVERFRDGSVQIQLVGDEALYGRNYIIEPNYADNGSTANPGYTGRPVRNVEVTVVFTSPWDIAVWPMVRYMYLPDYLAWHSPWYWGYWPSDWYAWNPWFWHYYYGYHTNWHNHYYAHFRHWNHIRYHGYYDFYYAGVRHWSKDVHKNINKGYYKETYSHPELQNEGRALHARIATESNRTRLEASGESRIRRTVPDNARIRSTGNTSEITERRPDNEVSPRSASAPSIEQSTETRRRTTGTVTGRSEPQTPSANGTRPAATTTRSTRSARTAPADQVSTTSRRPAEAVPGRNAETPAVRETTSSSRRPAPSVSDGNHRDTPPASQITVATRSSVSSGSSAPATGSGGGSQVSSRSTAPSHGSSPARTSSTAAASRR